MYMHTVLNEHEDHEDLTYPNQFGDIGGTMRTVFRTACVLHAVFYMLFFEFSGDFQVGRDRRRTYLLCLVMYESHSAMHYSTFTPKNLAPHCGHVRQCFCDLVDGKSHINGGLLFSKRGGVEAPVAIVHHCDSHYNVAWPPIPQSRQMGLPGGLQGR